VQNLVGVEHGDLKEKVFLGDTFENVLENCTKMSVYLEEELNLLKNKYNFITEIRISGLMVGIVLKELPATLLGSLKEKGVIALTAGENVLRLLPPLNTTKKEIQIAIKAIDSVFSEIA